jgi:hypothetical protein
VLQRNQQRVQADAEANNRLEARVRHERVRCATQDWQLWCHDSHAVRQRLRGIAANGTLRGRIADLTTLKRLHGQAAL